MSNNNTYTDGKMKSLSDEAGSSSPNYKYLQPGTRALFIKKSIDREISRRLSEAGCPHVQLQQTSHGHNGNDCDEDCLFLNRKHHHLSASVTVGIALLGASFSLILTTISIVSSIFQEGSGSGAPSSSLVEGHERGTEHFGTTLDHEKRRCLEGRNSYEMSTLIPITFVMPTIVMFWLIGVTKELYLRDSRP